MNYDINENSLEIDLNNEKYEPAMLLQHEDVKRIRINNYNIPIELPVEIHKLERKYKHIEN